MLFKVLTTCALYCVLLVPTYAEPVAIINGEIITQQDYNDYVFARAQQSSTQTDSPKRETIIQEIIQRQLIKQDAIKNGVDKEPEFLQKLEAIRNSMLMALGMQKYLDKHPLDDATLRSEYDKKIAHIKVPEEYKVRHILLKTEDEAKAIIAEIGKGKAFGDLAKEKSLDIGSAKNNGDLGWITTQKVVPSFGVALDKLEKGSYTLSPIKSQFGWHIIQVDDIRIALPPFESVKAKIKSALQYRLMQEYVISLRNQAQIEIFKP